jgi:hypothetical protein
VTPPPSRWKLPALLSASLLLVAVTGSFTYARFRNDAARRRVEAACDVIRRGEQDRKTAMERASKLVAVKGDADKIATIEKAMRPSRVCEPLREQLSGYHWNFGRHWSPPPVDMAALASREEIAAIGARARPRCIAQMGMFLELMSGDGSGPSLEKRQELLDLCDLEKQSTNATTRDAGAQPLRLLDEWPAELERMAAGVAPAPQPASSSLD